MKRILSKMSLPLLLALFIGLVSCGSTATVSGGLTDEAYVILTAKNDYVGRTVYLRLNSADVMSVRLVKDEKKARKARRITIRPGRHLISITDEAHKPLYQQEIFVSTGNAKIIALP